MENLKNLEIISEDLIYLYIKYEGKLYKIKRNEFNQWKRESGVIEHLR